jgi:hypothetical protein
MAWVAPSTKSTGLLVTAAIWNEQVTGNLAFLGDAHNHSGDAGDGATISTALPSGIILMFDAACPYGWTRVAAFDGKFIRGAAAYGATGGSEDDHTHPYAAHTHLHTHATGYTQSAPSASVNYDHGSGGSYYISSGAHTNHAINDLSASGTATNEVAAGNSDSPSSSDIPPYVCVVFCKRN